MIGFQLLSAISFITFHQAFPPCWMMKNRRCRQYIILWLNVNLYLCKRYNKAMKIILRPLKFEDWHYFAKWWHDPELISMTSGNPEKFSDKAIQKQVQEMVKVLLHLKEIPKPDDAADALAIALCCAQSQKFKI